MNSERASSAKVRRLTTPVKCLRKDPRGARHWGAISRHKLLFGRSVRILTMMQSCASAAKLRAAGPFFRSASSAMFEYGFPPPRSVNSAVVLKTQRERRMVLSAMLVPVSPFRTLDVRRRPAVVRQW